MTFGFQTKDKELLIALFMTQREAIDQLRSRERKRDRERKEGGREGKDDQIVCSA